MPGSSCSPCCSSRGGSPVPTSPSLARPPPPRPPGWPGDDGVCRNAVCQGAARTVPGAPDKAEPKPGQVAVPRTVAQRMRSVHLQQRQELSELRGRAEDAQKLPRLRINLLERLRHETQAQAQLAAEIARYDQLVAQKQHVVEQLREDSADLESRLREKEAHGREMERELNDRYSRLAAQEQRAVLILQVQIAGVFGADKLGCHEASQMVCKPLRQAVAQYLCIPSRLSCASISGKDTFDLYFHVPPALRSSPERLAELRRRCAPQTSQLKALLEVKLNDIAARVAEGHSVLTYPLDGVTVSSISEPQFVDGAGLVVPESTTTIGMTPRGRAPGVMSVFSVEPGSWAEKVGVLQGDTLLWVNQQPLNEVEVECVAPLLRTKRPLAIYVCRPRFGTVAASLGQSPSGAQQQTRVDECQSQQSPSDSNAHSGPPRFRLEEQADSTSPRPCGANSLPKDPAEDLLESVEDVDALFGDLQELLEYADSGSSDRAPALTDTGPEACLADEEGACAEKVSHVRDAKVAAARGELSLALQDLMNAGECVQNVVDVLELLNPAQQAELLSKLPPVSAAAALSEMDPGAAALARHKMDPALVQEVRRHMGEALAERRPGDGHATASVSQTSAALQKNDGQFNKIAGREDMVLQDSAGDRKRPRPVPIGAIEKTAEHHAAAKAIQTLWRGWRDRASAARFRSQIGIRIQVSVEPGTRSLGLLPTALPPARVVIRAVDSPGWAKGKGLRRGDELLSVSGEPVGAMSQKKFAQSLRSRPASLVFWRPGTRYERESGRPYHFELLAEEDVLSLGCTPELHSPEHVIVGPVDGWVAAHGVRPTDRLLEINLVAVAAFNIAEMRRALRHRPVRILFARGASGALDRFWQQPQTTQRAETFQPEELQEYSIPSETRKPEEPLELQLELLQLEKDISRGERQLRDTLHQEYSEDEESDGEVLEVVLDDSAHMLGWTPVSFPPGPVVVGEVERSFAEEWRVRDGDILVKINGRPAKKMQRASLVEDMRTRPLRLVFKRRVDLRPAYPASPVAALVGNEGAFSLYESLVGEYEDEPVRRKSVSTTPPPACIDTVDAQQPLAQASIDEAQRFKDLEAALQRTELLEQRLRELEKEREKETEKAPEAAAGAQTELLSVGVEDTVEYKFLALSFAGLDEHLFQRELFVQLRQRRVSETAISRLKVRLREGSVIAALTAAPSFIEEVRGKVPDKSFSVMGSVARLVSAVPEEHSAAVTVAVVADRSVRQLEWLPQSYPPGPVRLVEVGGWAYDNGMRVGDEIVEVNGRAVSGMQESEFKTALKERPLELLYLLGDEENQNAQGEKTAASRQCDPEVFEAQVPGAEDSEDRKQMEEIPVTQEEGETGKNGMETREPLEKAELEKAGDERERRQGEELQVHVAEDNRQFELEARSAEHKEEPKKDKAVKEGSREVKRDEKVQDQREKKEVRKDKEKDKKTAEQAEKLRQWKAGERDHITLTVDTKDKPLGCAFDKSKHRTIEKVEPDSWAERHGLKVGDVLQKINEQPTDSIGKSGIKEALKSDKPQKLTFVRKVVESDKAAQEGQEVQEALDAVDALKEDVGCIQAGLGGIASLEGDPQLAIQDEKPAQASELMASGVGECFVHVVPEGVSNAEMGWHPMTYPQERTPFEKLPGDRIFVKIVYADTWATDVDVRVGDELVRAACLQEDVIEGDDLVVNMDNKTFLRTMRRRPLQLEFVQGLEAEAIPMPHLLPDPGLPGDAEAKEGDPSSRPEEPPAPPQPEPRRPATLVATADKSIEMTGWGFELSLPSSSNWRYKPVLVTKVEAEGWAATNTIFIGDELVEVNGISLVDMSKDDCKRTMKEFPVNLGFARGEAWQKREFEKEEKKKKKKEEKEELMKSMGLAGPSPGAHRTSEYFKEEPANPPQMIDLIVEDGVVEMGWHPGQWESPIFVVSVDEGSWAEGKGIQIGDELVTVQGDYVITSSAKELQKLLLKRPLALQFERKPLGPEGKRASVFLAKTAAADAADSGKKAKKNKGPERIHLNLVDGALGFQYKGVPPTVEVRKVDTQSHAALHGILKGDLLVSVNDKSIEKFTESKFAKALEKRPLKLTFERPGKKEKETKEKKDKKQKEPGAAGGLFGGFVGF